MRSVQPTEAPRPIIGHPFMYRCVIMLYIVFSLYREIMNLSNKLIYGDSLKCGTEEVALGRLYLPHLEIHSVPSKSCSLCERVLSCTWLRDVVDPCRPVLFVNTDHSSSSRESIAGNHVCNILESKLVACVVDVLLKVGVLLSVYHTCLTNLNKIGQYH